MELQLQELAATIQKDVAAALANSAGSFLVVLPDGRERSYHVAKDGKVSMEFYGSDDEDEPQYRVELQLDVRVVEVELH